MPPRVVKGRRWLDYDEAGEVSGYSAAHIKRLCWQGTIRSRVFTWKAGNYRRRKRMIWDDDLLRWMFAHSAVRSRGSRRATT